MEELEDMIKVKISYKDQEDKLKIIEALKPLGIIKIRKEQQKPGHNNVYIELQEGRLTVIPNQDTAKLKRQIEALKYAISTDTIEKDRQIHINALKALEAELIKREGVKHYDNA